MSVQHAKDYFRFCPGEEDRKLSNAVCRGRRRTSFPKCKGCQFNDEELAQKPARPAVAGIKTDEAGPTSPANVLGSVEVKAAGLDSLFRETDVRGLCPLPLSAAVAWRIGYAAAQFLRSRLKGYDRADPKARSLVTGCDTRSSSAAIHPALTSGIRAAGVTIYDLGMIDTPQLYFAVRHIGAGGGIMTTGGRDPSAYSGFKLCGAGARDVATATGLTDIRDIARRVPQHETGTFAPRFELNVAQAYRDYMHRLCWMPPEFSRPLTVVVDASDGVAGHWVGEVFGGIDDIRLIMLNDTATEPFTHEPDPTDPANLTALRRSIKASRADLGVCFDGDADACVFLDERGVMLRPDMTMALLARHVLERRGAGTIVIDHRASRIVSEEVERVGGIVRRERAGSQHIRKAMTETDAWLGASLSGQIYFRDNANCESALLIMGMMLSLCGTSSRKLSDLVRPLLRYRTGERRVDVQNVDAALASIAEHYRGAAQETLDGLAVRSDDWWFHAGRIAGNASLMLRAEARSAELLKQRLDEITSALQGAAST